MNKGLQSQGMQFKALHRYGTYIAILVIILSFMATRFINLDRDQADYNLTQLGSKDEQAYNFTAINLHHFGTLTKQVSENWEIKGSLRSIMNTFPVYVGLELFGNNYHGLRIPAALYSLAIMIVVLMISFKKLQPLQDKMQLLILCAVLLFISFDFSFLAASRNAAPVVFRALYVLIFCSLLGMKLGDRLKYHLMIAGAGAFCTFLIFFSYFTNVFSLLAVFLYIVISSWYARSWKHFAMSCMVLFVVIMLAYALSELINRLVYQQGIIESVKRSLGIYGNRLSVVAPSDASLPWYKPITRTVGNLRVFADSMVFRLNASVFILLFLSLVLDAGDFIRRQRVSKIRMATFSVICAYICQSLFYNPHSSKWIVIILPVVALELALFLNRLIKHQKDGTYPISTRVIVVLAIVLFAAFTINSFLMGNISRNSEILYLVLFSLLISLVLIVALTRIMLNPGNRAAGMQLLVLLMVAQTPGAYLSFSRLLLNPTFYYRDALIELDYVVGDSIVGGGWSDGFRLYTTGKTLHTWYQNQSSKEEYRKDLTRLFDEGVAAYSVEYSEDSKARTALDIFKDVDTHGKDYKMIPVKSMYIGDLGYADSLILIRRVPLNYAEGF